MVKNLLVVLIVLLGIGACIINMHLTSMHYSGTITPKWIADGCTPEDNPTYNCEEVVKTKWAVFPPQDPDPETGLQAGIP